MPDRWTIFAKHTHALEKKYVPSIKRIIVKFRSEVIGHLQQTGIPGAQQYLNNIHLDKLLPIVQSIYKTAGLMGARLTAQELKEMAAQKSGSFGRNEAWVQSVIDYLRLHLLEFVQDMTETMKGDILKIFEKAIDEGWGIDQIVEKLKGPDLAEARARVIARTEIIRAANVGHSIAAQSTPYEVDKKWSAANDHRTRHSHRYINDHQTDEYGTFKVPVYKGDKPTGEFDEMQFPGDPTAHASNTVNCRCRVLYLPKRDSEGRLIMRPPNQARIIPMQPVSRIPAHQIAAALKANIRIGISPDKK